MPAIGDVGLALPACVQSCTERPGGIAPQHPSGKLAARGPCSVRVTGRVCNRALRTHDPSAEADVKPGMAWHLLRDDPHRCETADIGIAIPFWQLSRNAYLCTGARVQTRAHMCAMHFAPVPSRSIMGVAIAIDHATGVAIAIDYGGRHRDRLRGSPSRCITRVAIAMYYEGRHRDQL